MDAVFNRVGEIAQLPVRCLLSRVAISFYFGWPWFLAMGIYVYVAKPLCKGSSWIYTCIRSYPVLQVYQVILPCFEWCK